MRVGLRFVFVAAAAVSGCTEDLGTCDMGAATQLVYAVDGTPYTAGQGLVQYGCAEGVCHSAFAVKDSRKGAPHGVDFDVKPLFAQAPAANISALQNGIANVRDEAHDIYDQISSGAMPPGEAGARPAQAWRLADGRPANLPGLDTDVGKATVRNWLACGAPLVSGVPGAPAEATQIAGGAVRPPLESGPTGTSFQDIFTNILKPCADACHKPNGAYAALDLSTAAIAYMELVDKQPDPGQCAGKGAFVVKNNCDASLLVQKLKPNPVCGTQMPLGGAPLPQAQLDALCAWINAGAPQN